jgi:hypothetical protein
MACLQKLTLLAKYYQEVLEYAESVAELEELTAAIPFVEWELLFNLAQRTLDSCRAAQHSLQRHLAEHGCLADTSFLLPFDDQASLITFISTT